MLLLCVAFGLAMIAQTQGAGDGGWFWYATLLHNGDRLYSQMHLALQPLFVLETEFFLTLCGKGWIVSKIPAVLHLVAYCVALRLLMRHSDLSDAQKAVLMGCGFFFPLGFEAYRFDDYHVLADCFELYCLIALLALPKISRTRNLLLLAATLGTLCGLSMTTRLNDGAALFAGVALGVLVLAPRNRAGSLAIVTVAAALTVVVVVWFTGDTLRDYADYSIFHAAGSKGGVGSVMSAPVLLPILAAHWLFVQRHYDFLIAYIFLCATVWALLLRPLFQRRSARELAMAAAGLLAVAAPFPWMRDDMVYGASSIAGFAAPLASVAAVGTILICLLGLVIAVRLLRWVSRSSHPFAWERREVLLLIPIGQLVSGSMSSGGFHFGLYGPMGVLAVVLAICPPFRLESDWPRSFALAVSAVLVVTTAIFKFQDPYSWHTYRELPLFTGRTVYRHPVYGPMVIDKALLGMILPVCSTLNSSGTQPQLLSLPFSYANYFCATPPWNDYVQTFFDTSSKETIDGLMRRLDTAPPAWIFYQRQLATLALHERVYNGGRPLEHRYLDQLMEQKIARGAWRVVYSSSYGNNAPMDNHWLLIQTR